MAPLQISRKPQRHGVRGFFRCLLTLASKQFTLIPSFLRSLQFWNGWKTQPSEKLITMTKLQGISGIPPSKPIKLFNHGSNLVHFSRLDFHHLGRSASVRMFPET